MRKSLCLVLTLACAALTFSSAAAEVQPPVPIVRASPVYPYQLRKKRVAGSVTIEFIIEQDGVVRQAKVVQSTDSGFNERAIEAVLRWRFKPGLKDGKPINVRAQQRLDFEPPLHRLVYPFELLQAGIDGQATVGFWLDPDKHLKKVVVLQASRPEFGKAAVAALADDQAVAAGSAAKVQEGRYETTYTFNRKGSGETAVVSDSAKEIIKLLKKKSPEICDASELDAAPVAVEKLQPEFPLELLATHTAGEAVVEFFIDREGKAQLPRVVSASHEDFGYAAAQAVGQWEFAPPLRQGKPVVARVRMPVEFKLNGVQ